MSKSLDDLSQLLPSENLRVWKSLQNTEIIEAAIKHIKNLQLKIECNLSIFTIFTFIHIICVWIFIHLYNIYKNVYLFYNLGAEKHVLPKNFKYGYQECLLEMTRVLNNNPNFNNIVYHLERHFESISNGIFTLSMYIHTYFKINWRI